MRHGLVNLCEARCRHEEGGYRLQQNQCARFTVPGDYRGGIWWHVGALACALACIAWRVCIVTRMACAGCCTRCYKLGVSRDVRSRDVLQSRDVLRSRDVLPSRDILSHDVLRMSPTTLSTTLWMRRGTNITLRFRMSAGACRREWPFSCREEEAAS